MVWKIPDSSCLIKKMDEKAICPECYAAIFPTQPQGGARARIIKCAPEQRLERMVIAALPVF